VSLANRLARVWYDGEPVPFWLAMLEPVYRGLRWLHRLPYKRGWRKAKRVGAKSCEHSRRRVLGRDEMHPVGSPVRNPPAGRRPIGRGAARSRIVQPNDLSAAEWGLDEFPAAVFQPAIGDPVAVGRPARAVLVGRFRIETHARPACGRIDPDEMLGRISADGDALPVG